MADFNDLHDVTAEARRLDEMSRQSEVKKALKREADADDAESRMLGEIYDLESRLTDEDRRDVTLMTLRDRLGLSRKAGGETRRRSAVRRGGCCVRSPQAPPGAFRISST